MSFSPPKPPDPNNVSSTQLGYNQQAAQSQQQMNMMGQNTPFASMQYVKDPSSPSGYRMQMGFNGASGTNYNTLGNLANNVAGMYSQAPNLDPSTMTANTMAMEQKYLQPSFDIQNSNMSAQLQNQGFAPGSEAYTNAMRGLTQGQQGTMANTFLQAEPMAFNQALQAYNAPMNTMQGLMGMLGQTGFQQTPQAQVQAPNYAGLVENQYDQQNKNYMGTMQGLTGIGSSLAGGWAMKGFPGMGGFGGMFSQPGGSGSGGYYGGAGQG